MPGKLFSVFLVLIFVANILAGQERNLYDEGMASYREKDYTTAISHFEEHTRRHPDEDNSDDAKWMIGRALLQLGRENEAEQLFRGLSGESGNRQDDAKYELGRLLFESENFEESSGVFQAILADYPDSSRADDALWYMGEIHRLSGRTEEAEEAYLAVIATESSNRRDEALYSLGYLQYTEKQNDAALETFNRLVSEYPDDVKADDALWRTGRIYMRQERMEEAETAFLMALSLPSSNRVNEAQYDLGRIQHYTYEDFPGVIQRFSSLIGQDELSLYQRKGVHLGARAYYSLGLQARREYRDVDAIDSFSSSIQWLEFLLEIEPKESEQAEILTLSGKSYARLSELSTDKTEAGHHAISAENAFRTALDLIGEPEAEDVQKYLSDIRQLDSPYINYELTALGGYETLVAQPGARISAEVAALFPINYRNLISAEIDFDHEDLSIKTFNFDPDQTGTDRLISRNDTLGINLMWKSGSPRSFLSDFDLKTSYRWAEDPGDNRFLASATESLQWRINSNWELETDISATLKIYPDYLSGTNKIDSFTPAFNPELSYHAIDWLQINLEYELAFKQYLQATYGTSSKNKQYLTNSGTIGFEGHFGVFRPALSYELTWLKSYNYDLTVSGLPAPQYVEDYWDNLTHSIRLDLDFRWSSRFKTNLSGEFDYRAFANYPARDESKTFTGELRKDLGLEISLDAEYVFLRKLYTSFSAVLEAAWVMDSSNMLYDSSIATNFNTFGVYMGVNLKRR